MHLTNHRLRFFAQQVDVNWQFGHQVSDKAFFANSSQIIGQSEINREKVLL
ncbi:Uncharacterised protein [Vibrio cholerae]|nr:Uncharacterised protein [Vibrio cholerae]CSB85322.1 Uncharacterised protein [Vibrio cholerae]CSC04295.1 Uncharacterised protein [Vibrio cholerae]CSD17672.1 Uncharacterised protein [Vibrio cholerae]